MRVRFPILATLAKFLSTCQASVTCIFNTRALARTCGCFFCVSFSVSSILINNILDNNKNHEIMYSTGYRPEKKNILISIINCPSLVRRSYKVVDVVLKMCEPLPGIIKLLQILKKNDQKLSLAVKIWSSLTPRK